MCGIRWDNMCGIRWQNGSKKQGFNRTNHNLWIGEHTLYFFFKPIRLRKRKGTFIPFYSSPPRLYRGCTPSSAMIGSIPSKDIRHLRQGWRTSPTEISANTCQVIWGVSQTPARTSAGSLSKPHWSCTSQHISPCGLRVFSFAPHR